MSTPVAHILSGAAYYAVTTPAPSPIKDWRLLAWMGFLSLLPDLDFVPVVVVGFDTANRYHHTYSHTFAFALVAGLAAGYLWQRVRGGALRQRCGAAVTLVSLHMVVDYFTRDTRPPLGTMLFWPITENHYLSPVPLFLGVAKKDLSSMLGIYNVFSITTDALVLGFIIAMILYARGLLPSLSVRRLKRD